MMGTFAGYFSNTANFQRTPMLKYFDARNNSSVRADFIAINWNNISALVKEKT
jgi:hypothetical protein